MSDWFETAEQKYHDLARDHKIELPARLRDWQAEIGCSFTYISELRSYLAQRIEEIKQEDSL